MVRLDERMRIGSRARDRLGMVCATAAVACLASLMIQSSSELQVQCSPWEQDLFGDLSVPAGVHQQGVPFASSPLATESAENIDTSRDEPILVDVMPNSVEPAPARPLAPGPAESQPQFIQPVRHQRPGDSPTVWLSGGIELLSDESATTSQHGSGYCSDAHREQARH